MWGEVGLWVDGNEFGGGHNKSRRELEGGDISCYQNHVCSTNVYNMTKFRFHYTLYLYF